MSLPESVRNAVDSKVTISRVFWDHTIRPHYANGTSDAIYNLGSYIPKSMECFFLAVAMVVREVTGGLLSCEGYFLFQGPARNELRLRVHSEGASMRECHSILCQIEGAIKTAIVAYRLTGK